MVDYRKFLGKSEEVVAPWFGGESIDLANRRLRLTARPEKSGWFRFEVKGRTARAVGAAEPVDLSELPRVRGFFWNERLVSDGARAEILNLMPEEEPALFAPVTARRWHGGELIFDQLEFESEAEGQVRSALADAASIKDVKAVSASLRAAFAYALGQKEARRLGTQVSAAELKPSILRITEGAVEAVIRALMTERALAEREMRELRQRHAAEALRNEVRRAREARAQTRHALEDRLFDALDAAGGRLESHRRLGEERVEVVFRFMDTRFVSVVDAATLQVIDSGICLGHPPRDGLVTLESLPSVIKEAIDTDALVILRHA